MKLNIEIAKHERMASSGSSLLRSFQNEDLPKLDLIVRESIQNSLDAHQPDAKFVGVDFTIGDFKPALLNAYFESIGPVLNERYKGKTCKFLAIKDYNTVGLTGKLHYDEVTDQDFGNLQKLVYEVSKPQIEDGAGGSWGLGKTVYFRIGIGLVIYYSRIIDKDGNYASRLAATLVENETKPDSIIQYPNTPEYHIKRGIAWWGKKYGKWNSKSTCPITDQSSINNILQMLNISPYSGTNTGTTIIIPYIDEADLLKGIAPAEGVSGYGQHYYWLNSVEEYLKLAIQRWYTPRLSPKYERGAYLKASVNGTSVTSEKLAPYYKILYQLYENTTKRDLFAVGSQVIDGIEYFCQKVNTRSILTKGQIIGYVSYAKVTEKSLGMGSPDNEPNPYAFAGKYDVGRETNPPLICYIRKPGMVVSYETTGDWLDGVPQTTGEEYIVALFVLNSENEVKNYPDKTLEEYVRKGEKSDHAAWFDHPIADKQAYVVSRIKSNTSKILRSTFAQIGAGPTTLTHSGLEKALADLLLPPDGFGHRSNNSGRTGSHGGQETSHSGKSPMLKITGTEYHGDIIVIDFNFSTGRSAKNIFIELQVVTDNNVLSAEKWEKPTVIGTEFPLQLVSFELFEKEAAHILSAQDDTQSIAIGPLTVSCNRTSSYNVPYGIMISDSCDDNVSMTGKITFKRSSRDISGAVSITQKGDHQQ